MSSIRSESCLASRSGASGGRSAGAALARRWLNRVGELLLIWAERSHQRRQLQLLTQRDLRDLNLTRGDVEQEASKPFWRS